MGFLLLIGVVGYGQANALSVVLSDSDLTIGETSTVTITFDVAVQLGSFTEVDLNIPNGSFTTGLSTSDNIVFTATYTPNPGIEQPTNVITVDNTGVNDEALGNPGTGTTSSANFAIDTLAPSVAITSVLSPGPTSTSPIPITIIFSEAVTGFVSTDIVAGNGTVSGFAGSGTTYTANITPTANGLVTVDVAAGVAIDGSSNGNTAAPQFSIVFDNTGPSVAITSVLSPGPTSTSPIPITIIFSEAVTGFVSTDIVAGNGTVSGFAGSGTTYTANITPTANGLVTVDVAAGVAIDGSSNGNTAAPQFSIVFDNTGPSVAITSVLSPGPTSTSPIPITIIFSEAVTGFVSTDIVAGNGTVSGFAGSGTTYTANITPTANGLVTVDVAAGVAIDGSSNGNTAAPQFSIVFDNTGPSVAITSVLSPGPTSTSPIPITIIFSEAVTGFVSTDIVAGNGTVSGFAGSGTTYTANITPTANGLVTVDVAAGVAIDGSSNGNTAAPQFSIVFDNTGPSVAITSVLSPGPTSTSPIPITIIFSEAVTGFVSTDIVAGNGTVSGFAGSGTTYTANITPTANGLVTVDVAAGVAIDGSSNGNTAAPQFSIVFDNTGPSVAITSVLSPGPTSTSPIPITIIFSEAVTGFVSTDIVAGNGTVSGFAGSGTTYTANITPTANGLVTVDVAAGVAIDGSSNGNTAAPQFSIVFDNTGPSVAITSVLSPGPTSTSPIPITIIFSEAVTGFVSTDIVAGNGTVSGFAGSGTTYTANITPTANGLVTVDVAAGVAIDGSSNGNTAAPQFSIVFDNTGPTGYTVTINQDPINLGNETAVSFTFTGAELGATYNYTFNSTGGGAPVTGSGTVVSAGETISGINLSGLGDGTVNLSVTLTDTLGNIGSAATDNAAKVSDAISISDISFAEGNAGTTTFIFTVSVDGGGNAASNIGFTYNTANGTATAGTDYVAIVGSTGTITAGTNSTSVSVSVNGDTAVEANETFFVNLSAPVNATINDGQGQGTIQNDDSASISINDPTPINEGNSGVQTLTFTVSLGQSDPNNPITVGYLISGGNEDTDTGILTFAAGTTTLTQNITVTTNGDTLLEGDEDITVTLNNASTNANLVKAIGVSSFLNDDFASISINDPAPVAEGDAGPATINFTVSITQSDPSAAITVDYVISGGNENGTGNTLTFPAGTPTLTQTISVTTTGDTAVEPNEPISVTLGNASLNAVISKAVGNSSFTNDDTASISINDPASVPEGNSGVQTINFAVSIDQSDPNNNITVQYTISGGNEDTDTDVLTFLAGTTSLSQTIPVTTNGDTAVEADESVSITLNSPSSNATIVKGLGSSSFTNDDSSTISINDPTSVLEGDTGITTINFAVTLGQSDPNNPITVDYAINGGNENGTGSTLTFDAGTTTLTQIIPVTTNGDFIVQADLPVSVTLSNPSGNASLAADNVGISSFIDDDVAGFTVSPLTLNTTEGGVGQSFSVVLDAAPATNVIILLASSDTSEGNLSESSLTFNSGNWNTPRIVNVIPFNDSFVDGDQNYTITASVDDANSNNFFDALPDQTIAVTNSDDDTVGIIITAINGNTTEDGVAASFTIFLESEPSGDVIIPLSSNDPGEGTISVSSVTLNAANWDTGVSVVVTGVDDAFVDGPVSYAIITGNVTSTDPNYDILTGANLQDVAVTNNDNDTASISINNRTFNEGIGSAVFTVTLTGEVEAGFTVDYITSNNTAQAGSDYTATSGTLTFAGSTGETQTLQIPITDDPIVEQSEIFLVTLNNVVNPGNITISKAIGVGSITDNDAANVTIDDITVNESDGQAIFTVTLTGNVPSGFSVNYATADDTALDTEDYLSTSGSVTFSGNDGETQTITVQILDDGVVEQANEDFFMNLTGISSVLVSIGDPRG